MNDSNSPQYFALLIAVDFYFPNQLPNGASYGNLKGCVNDVNHVEHFLKRKLDLPDSNIIKLSSTNNGQVNPPESASQLPTYENMVAAFKKIRAIAKPGDQIYVHYSGHGGRAKTRFADKKGPMAYDEALVPCDIGNTGARYLLDVEMAFLLKAMVDDGLLVTVVFDSCHSGGMTRGTGAAVPRGIGVIDTTDRPGESLVTSNDELASLVTSKSTRNVTLGAGWLPEPEGYTLLAACRPNELAYEDIFDESGEKNGALTYWLLKSMEDLGPGLSYKVLHDRILAEVHGRFAKQSPQLQGEGGRTVLGNQIVAPAYAINVISVEEDAVKLAAGQVHGLKKSDTFAIFPNGTTDFTNKNEQKALVKITALGATESTAQIETRFADVAIMPGDQAVLTATGTVKMVGRISVIEAENENQAARHLATLSDISAAIEENPWLQLASSDIDYQVAINDNNEIEIWDSAGNTISNLRPLIMINDKDATTITTKRLEHLARYNAIRSLVNYDPYSPLAGKLHIEFAGKQYGYTPGEPPEPQPFDRPGGVPASEPGDWVFLKIRNDSSVPLNVTLFDLEANWAVNQIWPRLPESYVVMEPGQEIPLPLKVSLPDGYTEGTDILKAFATIDPTSFHWLILPALDKPVMRGGSRGGTRQPANPLEQLMAVMSDETPKTRTATVAAYPSAEWLTAQTELQITHQNH